MLPSQDSSYQQAFEAFTANYPCYRDTAAVDDWRSKEFSRLDENEQIYLDYTGGSLFAQSQLDAHMDMLKASVFGNPHSANPTSTAMTHLVERTRRYVLNYFNGGDDYFVVFTANASGALKLIGESFPFGPGGRFLATFDNHNSVNGIREYARSKGADVAYTQLIAPELRLDQDQLDQLLSEADSKAHNLFAFPAQSNFSGVKHPLSVIEKAQAHGWKVLLDAAAFVPTNRLDLQKYKPDYVSISFYKMFGYPTGVGALLVRRSAFPSLRRPWFAGGTVNFAAVHTQAHMLSANEAAFEDGTLNYLSIPAVEIGLKHLESVGIETIQSRVRCLTGWLLESMGALRHSNGQSMIRLYGPCDTTDRGGTVTFNVYDPDRDLLDYRQVEDLAGSEGISLRTGCFCNPGTSEMAEGLTEEDLVAGFELKESINLRNFVKLLQSRDQSKSAGAIRVSLGLASNFHDVWRFVKFLKAFKDKNRASIGVVADEQAQCRFVRDSS
jgi:selenocysteine lyase/cysteine desulfurase